MSLSGITARKIRPAVAINYAIDPEKTTASVIRYDRDGRRIPAKKRYVTGLNCDPDLAAEQFDDFKDYWGRITGTDKKGGVTCYSAYLAFQKGEVDPDKAHRIGVELAKRMWGKDTEVVIATHLNTDRLHCHFVINSVSFPDGAKIHDLRKGNWALIEAANRICRENGLETVEVVYGRKGNRAEHIAEAEGKPSMRNLIRWDIDRAVGRSFTMSEFYGCMEKMGYEILLGDSRWRDGAGLKPPGSRYFYSFRLLGKEYTIDMIAQRILETDKRNEELPRAEILQKAAEERDRRNGLGTGTGLPGLFRRYTTELDLILEYPVLVEQVPFSIRRDLIHTERLEKILDLLERNTIMTPSELVEFTSEAEKEIAFRRKQRSRYYQRMQKYTKTAYPEENERLSAEARQMTPEIVEMRKDIRLLKFAQEYAARIPSELDYLMLQQEQITRDEEHGRKEEDMRDEQLLAGRGGSGREDEPSGN